MNRCKSGCVDDMEPWRGNDFPMHAGKNSRQTRLFEQEERDKRRKNTCPRPLEWTKSPQREYVKDRCIPMGEWGKEGGKESRKNRVKPQGSKVNNIFYSQSEALNKNIALPSKGFFSKCKCWQIKLQGARNERPSMWFKMSILAITLHCFQCIDFNDHYHHIVCTVIQW